MTVSRSYYELLGILQTADLQKIKKAFHSLSKLLHPDTTLLPVEEAEKEFRQVCEAYELLSDPIRRKNYDNSLEIEKSIKKSDKKEFVVRSSSFQSVNRIGNRRPLSGGELFSLLLLCIALGISLLLGIIFAVVDGKNLEVSPSWLQQSNQSFINDSSQMIRNV